MAKTTARHHPHVISSQSPEDWSGPAELRPEPTRAHSIATTPSPNEIRMKQPKNSAHNSPKRPFRHESGRKWVVIGSLTVATEPPPKTFGLGNAPPVAEVAGDRSSEDGHVPASSCHPATVQTTCASTHFRLVAQAD